MSDERLADLEMRWSVGRLTAEDVAELLREVRRLRALVKALNLLLILILSAIWGTVLGALIKC